MKNIILLILIVSLASCSSSKILSVATEGNLSQAEFIQKIPFLYAEKHLFIDVSINGEMHTFLFDTGFEVSMIDKDLLSDIDFHPIKKNKTSGSSFDTQKIQYGFLPSLTIDGISFQDIGIGIQDLSFIRSPFADNRKIAGVIGTNVLRKAYWQINYQDSTMRFSDQLEKLDIDSQAMMIPMNPRNTSGWGYNRIELHLDGSKEQFIFDTGSSGSFTGNEALLERLESKESSTNMLENIIQIDQLVCGDITLEDVPLRIEKRVGLLIGNAFWENYLVTIDWKNNHLYLSPTKE